MKKRIIKLVIFTLIFCVLFSIANVLVIRVDKVGHPVISEFYSQREDSLDGVYIGASNGFTFWNPMLAWDKYGICVSSYSCNVNPFYSTEYIIKEARKTQSDATFIVNLNSLTEGELDESHMYNIINSMPFSRTKLELIDHLCDVSGYEGMDRAEYYFPFVRFHFRWSHFYTHNKLTVRPNGYKGAVDFYDYLNVSSDITAQYVKPTENVELSEPLVYSTDKLLDYCKEEDIKIVFVVVPQGRDNDFSINRIETMADYVSSKGFTVLNLTETADEEFNLDMTKDYYDCGHTNIHGSLKYTYYISEYLIENFGFEDKRNNEAYSDWHTSYENYMKVTSPHVLDVEFDYEHRDFTIDEPVLKVKTENNSAVVTWDSVENADGYLIYKKAGESLPWECIAEVSAADALQYVDSDRAEGEVGYYTVVPLATRSGTDYYGDFNYLGVSTIS